MTDWAVASLTILTSYLVGAIPFGYLVARWRGIDILHQGSGNIGATNVGRVLGKRFGILVFFFDFAKGALAVLAAGLVAANFQTDGSDHFGRQSLPVAAGLAAFLGHLFPVYLKFRGGKGVATGAGVVTMLLPGPALGALLTWIVVVCATRYVSLASVAAAVALGILHLFLSPAPLDPGQRPLTLFCLVAVCLVVARHRQNLGRLIQGNENRLQETLTMLLFSKTIHVLALGLWFGITVFFTFVVAPVVFHTFESMVEPASPFRASVPLPENYDKDKADRLAGAGLRPIFPWFFLMQGICGFLALGTAWAWYRIRPPSRVHKVRFFILTLALASVAAGWPLAQKVDQVRSARFDPDPGVAASARATFASWHLSSLGLDFWTIGLVMIALALAAQLPHDISEQPVPPNKYQIA